MDQGHQAPFLFEVQMVSIATHSLESLEFDADLVCYHHTARSSQKKTIICMVGEK